MELQRRGKGNGEGESEDLMAKEKVAEIGRAHV